MRFLNRTHQFDAPLPDFAALMHLPIPELGWIDAVISHAMKAAPGARIDSLALALSVIAMPARSDVLTWVIDDKEVLE